VLDRGRLVVETFERGALAGTDQARVPLTARHPRDAETLPIGRTVELEDRADGAWGAWHVSRTRSGDEVLELARDGVPLGLSVGFLEVPGGSRWSPEPPPHRRRRGGRHGARPGRSAGRRPRAEHLRHLRVMSFPRMSKRPRDPLDTEAVRYPQFPLHRE
jgi:hypothetical protein